MVGSLAQNEGWGDFAGIWDVSWTWNDGLQIVYTSYMSFPRLMDSNSCLFRVTADVFPPRYCDNKHLKAPDQQTTKASLTLGDDQLIKWFVAPGCFLPS